MPAFKDSAVIVKKSVGAKSEVVAEDSAGGGYTLYGAIVSSVTGTSAAAVLIPVVKGAEKPIPMPVDGTVGAVQSIALPAPVKCESIKATLVGAGTSMDIFYGP